MTDLTGIRPQSIVGFAFSGDGKAVRINPIADQLQAAGVAWVHLQRDDAEGAAWLHDRSGLSAEVVGALTAEDTRPRCTVIDDGALLNLRGVNLNPGDEPEDMVSIRLWLSETRIIGVWLRPLAATADVIAAAEKGKGPNSSGDFVAKLALRLIDRMEPVVAALNEKVDRLEERLVDGETAAVRGELAEVRRSAILLRRYIAPQRDALTTFAVEEFDWVSERDRRRLQEAADRTTRLAEDLDAIRERSAVIHDQLADRRAEDMNRHMLILAVVAAIFLPLGLLTGLLGMNVGGIPLASSGLGFIIVTLLLVVIGLVQYGVYKRLRLI